MYALSIEGPDRGGRLFATQETRLSTTATLYECPVMADDSYFFDILFTVQYEVCVFPCFSISRKKKQHETVWIFVGVHPAFHFWFSVLKNSNHSPPPSASGLFTSNFHHYAYYILFSHFVTLFFVSKEFHVISVYFSADIKSQSCVHACVLTFG